MKQILVLSLFCISIMSFYSKAYQEDSALFYGEYSDNFVTRWGFQGLCSHVFDHRPQWPTIKKGKGVTVNPHKVQKGDIVFVRDFEKFINVVHPEIRNPYIIVTSGEYRDRVQPMHKDFLNDDKIIAWFCVHPCQTSFHKKYTAIPLGVVPRKGFYKKRKQFNDLFTKLRQNEKTCLLYMNFWKSYGERHYVHKLFRNQPYCYDAKPKPFDEYMREMAQYKFALSPSGLGPDCFRTWEALLVGTIPIVKSGGTDELYTGLPVLIVKDWREITPGFLEKKWHEFTNKKYDINKLYLEYWAQKIFKTRDDFLQAHA